MGKTMRYLLLAFILCGCVRTHSTLSAPYFDYDHRAWAFINLNKHYHCGGSFSRLDNSGNPDWTSYGCSYSNVEALNDRTFENYHKKKYGTLENMRKEWLGKPDPRKGLADE